VGDADSLVGKVIEVKGGLGLTGSNALSRVCAPGECCHSLRFGMVLEGREVLFFPSLTCAGDDSKVCCSMPAEGQVVMAHGKLERAKGPGIVKWQIRNPTLCVPGTPPPPSPGMTNIPSPAAVEP